MLKELKYLKLLFAGSLFFLTFFFFILVFWLNRQDRNTIKNLSEAELNSTYNSSILYNEWISLHHQKLMKYDTLNQYKKSFVCNIDSLLFINQSKSFHNPTTVPGNEFQVKVHFITLKTQNQNDKWERRALSHIKDGEKKIMSTDTINGIEYLRSMQPIFATKACIACHSTFNANDGSIMGGISISEPLSGYKSISKNNAVEHLKGFGTIYLLIIALVFLVFKKMKKEIQSRNEVQLNLLKNEQILKEQNETLLRLNSDLVIKNQEFELLNKDYLIQNKELKRAKTKIEESEVKYRNAFQTSPDAVYIKTLDGTYIEINEGFTELTGYTRSEIINHKSLDLNIWNLPDDRKKLIERLQKNGVVENLESVFKCKNGSFRTVLTSASLINIDDQPHILSVTRDISERKAMENELILAKNKAEESDRLKSSFLANMSHEIRTPMNAIMGFSDLLLDGGLSGDKQQKYLELMHQRSNDLLRIIEDILDISRIEVNQLDIIECEFSIRELLKDVREYYQSIIRINHRHENPKFTINVSNELKNTSILSDSQRIKQVINNFLDNALKFTVNGTIEFGIYEKGKSLVFYVRDSGIGIPAEKHEIIFDRFRQADEVNTARLYGGTGLGLSIVKGIVNLLGGKVWLESRVGEGATFSFSIPYKSNKKDAKNRDRGDLQMKHKNWAAKSILIIEDDYANSEFLKAAIMSTGIKIMAAYNGTDALDIFNKNPVIDIVLMDIRLPDINGLDITRKIKKKRPDIKIIAQTAYAYSNDIKDCIDAGCDEYLTKPVQVKTLYKILQKCFDSKY